MSKSYKPVALIVMDGFGIWREQKGNPVYKAAMPKLEEISKNNAGVALHASGIDVGLPWGEMGNSEVGHYNIGAGLVVYQNLPRLRFALEDGSYYKYKVWDEMIEHAAENKSAIHLMGMVSSGGIHSHIDSLIATIQLLAKRKVKNPVFIHAFTDGQDVPAGTAKQFIEQIEKEIKSQKIGKIATVMGRHFSMDKNTKWELTREAFECLTQGKGRQIKKPIDALQEADENVLPSVVMDKNEPVGLIKENDAVFFFNYRPDRARQLTEYFLNSKIPNLFFMTMAQYRKEYPVKVVMPPQLITHPLAKAASDAGKKQFHIAETEKYAHVSYFVNGGIEAPFPNEDRAIIESAKVKSHTEKPEMGAEKIADRVLQEIEKGQYDLFVMNFANGDIMGHSGNFEAAIPALEALDKHVGRVVDAVTSKGGAVVITADHGNVEEMINIETGKVDTEHSANPVPCWMILPNHKVEAVPGSESNMEEVVANGILADVAPTVLALMDVPKPKEMTGNSLLGNNTLLPLK